MEESRSSNERLKISRDKLRWLLEITLAINENKPSEELLSRLESILRSELKIGKILIFKYTDKRWDCILNAGFPEKTAASAKVEAKLLEFKDVTPVTNNPDFELVDFIIPVFNNNVLIAFVLIGDIEEEGKGMSPVVKHLNFIQTISSIIIVAIENIRLFKESLRQEALRKEMELAARMQKMLIPHESQMPSEDRIVVNGFYFPHYEVGGDYYDCIRLSDTSYGFCIADVSGKGISAAILMSNFQASFRALLTEEIDLGLLVHKLNTIVVANAAGEKFITFFVARYNHSNGRLEYINAAHNAPVLFNTSTNSVIHLQPTCVGIGMLDEIPSVTKGELIISDYNKIVCYTDGLSELKDSSGRDIGTGAIIRHISNKEPVRDNIRAMLRELKIPDENPGLFDDVSIIAADLR